MFEKNQGKVDKEMNLWLGVRITNVTNVKSRHSYCFSNEDVIYASDFKNSYGFHIYNKNVHHGNTNNIRIVRNILNRDEKSKNRRYVIHFTKKNPKFRKLIETLFLFV